jgi:hypothetical protein
MNKDVLFILTDKYHGMILDCRKTENDPYEILTKFHGLFKVDYNILLKMTPRLYIYT